MAIFLTSLLFNEIFASLLIWKFCVRKISGLSNSFNKILQWTMLNDQLFLVINCKLRKMRRRKNSAFQWFINFDFFDVPWKLWKESSITVWEIWMYYFNKSSMGNTRIMIFIFWVKSANLATQNKSSNLSNSGFSRENSGSNMNLTNSFTWIQESQVCLYSFSDY